jgi:hypothetical protein
MLASDWSNQTGVGPRLPDRGQPKALDEQMRT